MASAAEVLVSIVLVHGGFVDGSGWDQVYHMLKRDGYTVSVVQNPTSSLADDVAATKRVLSGEKASDSFLIDQVKLVAANVTGIVGKGSGHWLTDEAPKTVIPMIVEFVNWQEYCSG